MTDTAGDITDNTTLQLLKLLLEQSKQSNIESNKSINTVTTLWIVLFSIIVLQKVLKYIAKPVYRHMSATNTRHNSDESRDNSI